MTNELQADVRAKLYRVLGDRGAVAAATSTTAASASSAAIQSPSSHPDGPVHTSIDSSQSEHEHPFLSSPHGGAKGVDEFGAYLHEFGDEDAFDADDYVPGEEDMADNESRYYSGSYNSASSSVAAPDSASSSNGAGEASTDSKRRISKEPIDGQEIHLQMFEDCEWECSTCTLINAPGTDACSVCAMPREFS